MKMKLADNATAMLPLTPNGTAGALAPPEVSYRAKAARPLRLDAQARLRHAPFTAVAQPICHAVATPGASAAKSASFPRRPGLLTLRAYASIVRPAMSIGMVLRRRQMPGKARR
jgi:hypothetical protein